MSLTKKVLHKRHLEKCENGSGGVSSWNDLTDRPFGDVLVEKEYIFERGDIVKLNGVNAYKLVCDNFNNDSLVAGQEYSIYYTAQSLADDSIVWQEYAPSDNEAFVAEVDENGIIYLGSPSVSGSYPFYFSSETCAVNYMWVNQFTYAQGVKLVGVFGNTKKLDEKYLPQVQADWNETDETSPAFIMNKPQSLGGYTYYYINAYGSSTLLRSTNEAFDDYSDKVENFEEFFNTYCAKPIMLKVRTGDADIYAPCIGYSISAGTLWVIYMRNGYSANVNTHILAEG